MAEKTTVPVHLTRHDREIAAIRKLVLTGMKMQAEIQDAQRETAKELKLLIRSLKSGHFKRKVDLQ